jgi:outer membrane protein, multidrug efflux system
MLPFRYYISIIILLLMCIGLMSCGILKPSQPAIQLNLPRSYDFSSASAKDSFPIQQAFFKQDTILTQLIDTAITYNFELLQSTAEIEGFLANYTLSQRLLYPALNAQTNLSLRKFGQYTMDGAGNRSTEMTPGRIVPEHLPDYQFGFFSTWEIDVWGKLRAMREAEKRRFLASIEAQQLLKTQIVFTVANWYFELIGFYKQIEVLDEYIKLQEKALSVIRLQKEVGTASELAVKQFEVYLIDSEIKRRNLLNQVLIHENKIVVYSGKYSPKVKLSERLIDQPAQLNSFNLGLPSEVYFRRPDVRLAYQQYLATLSAYDAARLSALPSVALGAQAGFQAFSLNRVLLTPESMAYSVLMNIGFPIFNWGMIRNRIVVGDVQQRVAALNYHMTAFQAYGEVNQLNIQLKNLYQLIELKEKEVSTLLTAINISLDQYVAGRATYLEVLFLQQTFLPAQLDLVDILKDILVQKSALYKALGGGWD